MKKRDVADCTRTFFGPTLAVVGLTLAGSTALAQSSAPPKPAVGAPSVVVELEPAPITKFVRIQRISYTQAVGYADLDLNKPSDVAELKRRVQDAINAGCAELDRRYPPNAYTTIPAKRNCVESATDSAAAQIHAAIAATRKEEAMSSSVSQNR